MTDNSTPSSPSKKEDMKALLLKGVIGAISLAGATAIPILVQRLIAPPAVVPPIATPASVISPQIEPTVGDQTPSTLSETNETGEDEKLRGRDKKEK